MLICRYFLPIPLPPAHHHHHPPHPGCFCLYSSSLPLSAFLSILSSGMATPLDSDSLCVHPRTCVTACVILRHSCTLSATARPSCPRNHAELSSFFYTYYQPCITLVFVIGTWLYWFTAIPPPPPSPLTVFGSNTLGAIPYLCVSASLSVFISTTLSLSLWIVLLALSHPLPSLC